MSVVVIQRATCSVPRVGAQAMRRANRDEFRRDDPKAAALLEAFPWYIDPDEEGSDQWAHIRYDYVHNEQDSDDSDRDMSSGSSLKVERINLLMPFVYGSIYELPKDDNSLYQYVFNLQAGYIQHVLMDRGYITRDCDLDNARNKPEKLWRKRSKDKVLTKDEFLEEIGAAMQSGKR